MKQLAFHIADEDDIRSGKVTDVYFQRVIKSLRGKGIDPHVDMEVRATSLPQNIEWAVLCGLEELLSLFEGVAVDIRSLDEGDWFQAGDVVLTISGRYQEFGVFETALLGLICQASGIATTAARCKKAAGERPVISFGARRMHPAISPMIERSAFIGGCDGVAVVKSAELIGEEPVGTMAHSLILATQDEATAYRAFDECVGEDVRRIALVDTFQDEKFGALYAAQVLGQKLYGVRLDTPGSRKGDFYRIAEEVRWELDIRGYQEVKIFLSGGLDEYQIMRFNPVADAYGVGTHISNSPVINFSLDIVQMQGKPLAKRGKKSGLKQLWECEGCGARLHALEGKPAPVCDECGAEMVPRLKLQMEKGKRKVESRAARAVRDYCLARTARLTLTSSGNSNLA